MSDRLPDWAPAALEVFERLRTQPCPRPVSGGIVVNRQGHLLLVYSSFASQGWHFPKGGIDEGETPLEGAAKETREEAGVEIDLAPHGTFDLGPGGTFTESLGFGSPRVQMGEVYNPVCVHFGREVAVTTGAHRGEQMSTAALELLRRACREGGVSEEEFAERRYALFDRWRGQAVCWQHTTTYHVLPFAEYRAEWLSGETQRVAWWSLDELGRGLEDEGGELHRHVRAILTSPGVRRAIESAKGRARPG